MSFLLKKINLKVNQVVLPVQIMYILPITPQLHLTVYNHGPMQNITFLKHGTIVQVKVSPLA